jgi:hypothetical protein
MMRAERPATGEDRFDLLGEVAHVVDEDFHRVVPILNLGFSYEFNENPVLLFSVGRSLRSSLNDDEPRLLSDVGLGFSL